MMDIRGLGGSDYLSSLMTPNLHHIINPNYDGQPIVGKDGDSVRIGYSILKHGFSVTSDGLIFRFCGRGGRPGLQRRISPIRR